MKIVVLFLLLTIFLLGIPLKVYSQDMKTFNFHTDASSGNGTEVDITGLQLIGVTILGSASSNRVVIFEVADNIGTYTAIKCTNVDTLVVTTGYTIGDTFPHRFQCLVGGFKKFRVRISGGSSGTLTAVGLGLAKATGLSKGGGENVVSGGVSPVGEAGTLQASDGLGGLVGYSGSNSCSLGTLATRITPTGSLVCDPIITQISSSQVWLSSPSLEFPSGVNLGSLGNGLIKQTVVGGISTPTIVPAPLGVVLGDIDPQDIFNKRINWRPTSLPSNVSPLHIIVGNAAEGFDLFVITELLQNTLIGPPEGSLRPGQILFMQVKTTVPRAITWDPIWQPEAGLPLPTTTSGSGGYDIWLWQYNATSGHMMLFSNSQAIKSILETTLIPGEYTCPTITISAQGRMSSIVSGDCVGGSSTIAVVGNDGDIQFKSGSILDADTGNLSHDSGSSTTMTNNLMIGAGPNYFQFMDSLGQLGYLTAPMAFSVINPVWSLNEPGEICVKGGTCTAPALATNGTNCNAGDAARGIDASGNAEDCFTPPIPTAAQLPRSVVTRTCMLTFGSEDAAAVLTNANLGPQKFGCVIPYAATVIEIDVYADAGTPNIIIHRRNGVTNTELLSSALATAASGALACSRITGVAGYAGTTCSATLQNTSIGAGDTIGATSGTAGGVAKAMSVAIHYELN